MQYLFKKIVFLHIFVIYQGHGADFSQVFCIYSELSKSPTPCQTKDLGAGIRDVICLESQRSKSADLVNIYCSNNNLSDEYALGSCIFNFPSQKRILAIFMQQACYFTH